MGPYWNPVAQQCVLCFRSKARRHKAADESGWVEGRTTCGSIMELRILGNILGP